MANYFKTIADNIRTKRYAKDVRTNIADGFEAVDTYTQAENAKIRTETTQTLNAFKVETNNSLQGMVDIAEQEIINSVGTVNASAEVLAARTSTITGAKATLNLRLEASEQKFKSDIDLINTKLNKTVVLPINAKLETEFADLTKFPYGTTPFTAQKDNTLPNSSDIDLYTFNSFPLTTSQLLIGTVTKVLGSGWIGVELIDSFGNIHTKFRTSTAWSKWKSATGIWRHIPLTTAIPVAGFTESVYGQNFVLDAGGTVRFIFNTGTIVEIPLKYGFLNVSVFFEQTHSAGTQRRYVKLTGGNNWEIGPATAISGTTISTTITRIEVIFN